MSSDTGEYQRLLATQLGKGGTVFDRNGLNRTLGLAWIDDSGAAELLPPKSSNGNNSARGSPKRKKKSKKPVRLERSATDTTASTVSSTESQVFVRSMSDKSVNPVRINLDRRQLAECPVIKYEPQLEVLNFQHNSIENISNIHGFQKLVFIDFYDNRIKEIRGLHDLPSLKVLMLGKNAIKSLSGLENIPHLDILDLHSNSINKMSGLSHLKELRILNLSGNQITRAESLGGMQSLLELNLRRNKIHFIGELDHLKQLQRLFLSLNELKSLDNLLDQVANNSNLSELTLDGNPLCRTTTYKTTILKRVPNLSQLDMRRITSQEKEIVQRSFIKQEERERKAREASEREEQKMRQIKAAEMAWVEQQEIDKPKDMAQLQSELQTEKTVLFGREKPVTSNAQGYAEIVGKSLKFYGNDSLGALDKDWGHYAMSAVRDVKFKFVDFNQIIPILTKLKNRFPNTETLTLSTTNLYCLTQLHSLISLKRLLKLFVTTEGNSITKFTSWIHYSAHRLGPTLGLQMVNDIQIDHKMMKESKEMFDSLDKCVGNLNPAMRLIVMNHRGKLTKKLTYKSMQNMQGAEFTKTIMRHASPEKDKRKQQAAHKLSYDVISEAKAAAKSEMDYESKVPQIFEASIKEAVHWIVEDIHERKNEENYSKARWNAFERWNKQQTGAQKSQRMKKDID